LPNLARVKTITVEHEPDEVVQGAGERLYIASSDPTSPEYMDLYQLDAGTGATLNLIDRVFGALIRGNAAGTRLFAMQRGVSPPSFFAYDIANGVTPSLIERRSGSGTDFAIDEQRNRLYM